MNQNQNDITTDDLNNASMELGVEEIKIDPITQPAQDKTPIRQQQAAQAFNLDQMNVVTPIAEVTNSQKNVEEFRRYLAKHISTFEAALFKAVAEADMNSEEKKMLEESWKGVLQYVIKDTNQEMLIAVVLLLTAHGTIYLMHKEDLERGINKIRQRKSTSRTPSEKVEKTVQKTVNSPSSDSLYNLMK